MGGQFPRNLNLMVKSVWVGYLKEAQFRQWFQKSLDLQISSIVVFFFKETNAFPVYAICFNETVHDKWCLHKSDWQTENGLELGFVKLGLNSV